MHTLNLHLMLETIRHQQILVCPSCHGHLDTSQIIECRQCNILFRRNQYGFIEFVEDQSTTEKDTTSNKYAKIQEFCGTKVYHDYLKPFLLREPCHRILDVGCGIGKGISILRADGYDAYGVDLPCLSKFWDDVDNNPSYFFCCDTASLPFPDNFFDAVYSLGVIEHIGTVIGHCTLSDNYWEARQQYANEILRVTKLGGRILIASPNKSFPIDVQHGPSDQWSPKYTVRNYIFNKTGMNIHRTWGKYHLLSYSEIKRLFGTSGGTQTLEALPLKGYFGFSNFQTGFLKIFLTLVQLYLNNLPKLLRSSFLNPYILLQIKKRLSNYGKS